MPGASDKKTLFLPGPQPPEDGHGAFAPNAVLFVFQRVNVKEAPSGFEQPVYFLATASLQVMAGDFGYIQLPEREQLQNCCRDFRGSFFSGTFSFGHVSPVPGGGLRCYLFQANSCLGSNAARTVTTIRVAGHSARDDLVNLDASASAFAPIQALGSAWLLLQRPVRQVTANCAFNGQTCGWGEETWLKQRRTCSQP